MLGQSLLQLLRSLRLELLGRRLAHVLARGRVAGGGVALCLRGVEVLDDALVVLLHDILGDTFHAEDLDVEALPVCECILDAAQVFLVDLVHVNRQAYSFTRPSQKRIRGVDCSGNVSRLLRLPPAVLSRLPHRSHLKCLAFW